MRLTHSDISRDFGMRSTSVKCDLTAASSPLSQPIAIATAADHHRHTTSGPVKQNHKLQPTGGHPAPSRGKKRAGVTCPWPVPSAKLNANGPKLIPMGMQLSG